MGDMNQQALAMPKTTVKPESRVCVWNALKNHESKELIGTHSRLIKALVLVFVSFLFFFFFSYYSRTGKHVPHLKFLEFHLILIIFNPLFTFPPLLS